MNVLSDYHEEDYNVRINPGEHRLKIVKAGEKVFKSGNIGLDIELVNKDKVKFFYHIVKNEYFNRNLTRFYDCFNIRRGESDLNKWVNHYGLAHIDFRKTDGISTVFMEIKYLIVKSDGAPPDNSAKNPLEEKRRELVADINAVITRVNANQVPYFTDQEKKSIEDTVNRCGPYENGIQILEKEKERVTALLQEKEKEDRSFPNDIPF